MTITITRLANEHSGAASAQTDTYEGIPFVAGRQYLIIWHLLQNAVGSWDPEATVAVTDTDDDSWALVGSSTGTTAYTAGGTNGTTMIAHLTAPITADNADVDVATDFNDATTRQYIRSGAIYEIESDVGEVSVAQIAAQVNSTGTMSLDWPATPSGDLIVAWGIIHNSAATFATEPAGLTADDTNTASVCAYEIQVGASTADPLTTTLSVTGTDFDYHGLAIELSDSTGDSVAVGIAAEADTALAVTAAAGAVSTAVGISAEADTALAVTAAGGAVQVAVGLATETDVALAVTAVAGTATVQVGLAVEADTALAVTASGGAASLVIGNASETDTAVAITATPGAVSVVAGQAAETDTALPVSAAPGTASVAVGIASETDTALAVGAASGTVVAVGLATEADTARAVTVLAGAVSVPLGVATETDTALAVTPTAGAVTVDVGLAVETDTALVIVPAGGPGGDQSVAIGVATEADTARRVLATRRPPAGGGIPMGQLPRTLRALNRQWDREARTAPRRCPHSGHLLARDYRGQWRCPFDGYTALI